MNKTRIFFGIIILQLCSSLVFAGGPLVLEGTNGNTPVTYLNPNITVHVETGDLGALTNAAANVILQEAFNLWNGVSSSTINLDINEGLIIEDINLSNFNQYIPSLDGTIFNADDGLNPIVYDSNGEIIDAFFGVGASDNTVGFAASIFNINGSFFNEGYSVINGKPLNPPLTETEFKLLIAHEMGHFFGLDHTQTNINNQETISGNPFICSTSNLENYPIMYPFICRDVESLHADDVSAISALYPTTDIDNNFGIIEGRFVNESGQAILGANIWAKNITTGETVSIVSDYLRQGTGFYKLYLPPGNYTLHANSINRLFYDGSSIGPYASSLFDKSFVAPHPIPEVTYQGVTEGGDEIITVSSSQTLEINFSITGSDVVIRSSSSGSSGTSYITLLLLLSFLLLARPTGIHQTQLNRALHPF